MPDRDKPRQMPFALGHEPALTRDDLIVTPANHEAAQFMEQWPSWPSPVGVLVGPAGSGKTHLASIWCERSGARLVDGARIERFLADFQGSPGNVLIEETDSKSLDPTGLFHLLNLLREMGGSLLMTARSHPSTWQIRLPDLISRLKTASVINIGEPDDLLLNGVITKLFADRQIGIEPQIAEYLVRRMERSLVTANEIVERMDALGLERKVRMSRSIAAEVLEALDQRQD